MNMTFELWKALLRDDCEREDKVDAFDALGDSAFRLFWERGVDPTVIDILKDAEGVKKPS